MRNLLLCSLLGVAAITGCTKSSDSSAPAATATASAADKVEASLPTVSVDDVDTQIAKGTAQAVDANGEQTRKKMGVVPGAVLLTDSDSFALSELPADKSKGLVFYCANTACGASHHAAAKALLAGYTNVKVMPEGIAGWVKAGKKTTQI